MEEEEEEFDYSYISRVNISDPICQLCGYHLQLTSCTSEMKAQVMEFYQRSGYEIDTEQCTVQHSIWEVQVYDPEQKEWSTESTFWNRTKESRDRDALLPLRPSGMSWNWIDEWTSGEWTDERKRKWTRTERIESDREWFGHLIIATCGLTTMRHPMCEKCSVKMVRKMESRNTLVEQDIALYEAYDVENSLSFQDEVSLEEEIRQLQVSIQQQEDELALQRLKRKENRQKWNELLRLRDDALIEANRIHLEQDRIDEELNSVSIFSTYALSTLQRLQRYNVCNDSFHIWHDGQFGTINGLRLGRLASKPVDWVEINAALGQTAMLLETIAQQAGFIFPRHKLVVRGSYSKIINNEGREYCLYSDGSFLKRRSFNAALILLLECVDECGKQAIRDTPELKLPYPIQHGKIGDLSISLGDDEQWTRALKYMLTHLKWLLAWVAKR